MSDSIFSVVDQDGELVVDSRLVAERLGIEVKSFHRTINEYEAQIQEEFGCQRRENANVDMPTGGIRSDFSHYWLNEDAATFLMTLSRNSPQVVEAKLQLVKAFGQAKNLLMQAMRDRVSQLESQNKADRHLKKARTALNAAHKENPLTVLNWMRMMNADFGIESIAAAPAGVSLEEVGELSLAANRMGLSFNKHLKTFDALNSAFDPNALNSLRKACQESMLTVGRLEVDLAEARMGNGSNEAILKRRSQQLEDKNQDLRDQVQHLESLLAIEKKRTKVADAEWIGRTEQASSRQPLTGFLCEPAPKAKALPKATPAKKKAIAPAASYPKMLNPFSEGKTTAIARIPDLTDAECEAIAEAILALNLGTTTLLEQQAKAILRKFAENGRFNREDVWDLRGLFGGKFSSKLKAALKPFGFRV
jgi:phage regulator Rha-like protein